MSESLLSAESCDAPSSKKLDERHDPGPPPLQFRLKTLLAATAVLSVVFAAAGRLAGVWVAVLVWSLMLVAAHLAATVLGTQNSAHAPSRLRGGPGRNELDDALVARRACAPATRLSANARHGWRLWCVTAGGAVVGCVVGTTLVALREAGRLDATAFVLAAVSSSGVGAFLSFLAATCAKVASRALREAGGDGTEY